LHFATDPYCETAPVNSVDLGYTVIIVVLLGLAGFYTWRQLRSLSSLRQASDLSAADRIFFRNQAWRRLFGCALLVLLASLLIGSSLLGLERRTSELIDEAARQQGETPQQDPAKIRLVRLYFAYWVCAGLVLLAILFTAFMDIWAIRRFAVRHRRQIQADRRLAEDQLARLRQQGNGQH
jgi:ABC-type Fe3+ transport system permease subunit